MEVGSRIIERVSETEIQIQQQEMSDGFVKHLLVGKERTFLVTGREEKPSRSLRIFVVSASGTDYCYDLFVFAVTMDPGELRQGL